MVQKYGNTPPIPMIKVIVNFDKWIRIDYDDLASVCVRLWASATKKLL
jgi:hypothetical protein